MRRSYKSATCILIWLLMLVGCVSPTAIPEVGSERVEGKLWFECANENFTESSVCYMNLDGTWQVQEIADSVYGADVLAGGNQVAATSFAPGSDVLGIMALEMNDSWLSHSVYLGARSPRLSPNGKRIAFLVDVPAGEYQLGWSNWDGGDFQKLTAWSIDSYSWLVDSNSIVMSASPLLPSTEQVADRLYGIYSVDTLTLEVNEIAPPPSPLSGFEPSPSPDGRMLAYLVGVGRTTSKLIVLDIEDSKEVASLQVGVRAQFQWSPDSKSVAYFAEDRAPSQSCTAGELFDTLHIFEVGGSDRLAFDTSSLTCVSAVSSNGINLRELSWSPTGDLIALHWLEGEDDVLAIIQPDGHLIGKLPNPIANFRILKWTP